MNVCVCVRPYILMKRNHNPFIEVQTRMDFNFIKILNSTSVYYAVHTQNLRCQAYIYFFFGEI